jgi:CRISPR/Cas system CMR-associated protein Cmr3 (group 5 of RAMP superfamily)
MLEAHTETYIRLKSYDLKKESKIGIAFSYQQVKQKNLLY